MRQVWQNRWPDGNQYNFNIRACRVGHTTCCSCEVGGIVHADDAIKRVERGECLIRPGLRLDSILALLLQDLLD